MPEAVAVGTFGGFALRDALACATELSSVGVDVSQFVGRANYYTNPIGRGPGTGLLLMLKSDVDELVEDDYYEMIIGMEGGDFQPLTFPKMVFLSAIRLTPGISDDENSLYLVEIADKRVWATRTFINKSYNVRPTGDPNGDYFDGTTNDGEPWTWQEMLQDIWDHIPNAADVGTMPDLPFTPDGTPERFRYHGWTAWDAWNDVLHRGGMACSYNPVADSFSIYVYGAEDETLDTFVEDHEQYLLADTESVYSDVHIKVPEHLLVCFRNLYVGNDDWEEKLAKQPIYCRDYSITEYETLREIDTPYPVSVCALQVITDDLEAQWTGTDCLTPEEPETLDCGMDAAEVDYQIDGHDPCNLEELKARTEDRALVYYDQMLLGTNRQGKTYTGSWNILPYGKVSQVTYHNRSDVGWLTETYYQTREEWGRQLPLPEPTPAADDDDGYPDGTGGCPCDECFQGREIPDAVDNCCYSHLRWSAKNPWTVCEETDLEFKYIGSEQWLSQEFQGPAGTVDLYRFLAVPDIDGFSYVSLVVSTDNGGDPLCVIYGRDSFDCQCNNSFTLKKPYGTFIGTDEVDRSQFSCNLCLKPEVAGGCKAFACQWQDVVKVTIPDIFVDDCSAEPDFCDQLVGDHYLTLDDRPNVTTPDGLHCRWVKQLDETFDDADNCLGGRSCGGEIAFGVSGGLFAPIDGIKVTVTTWCKNALGEISINWLQGWAIDPDDFEGCTNPLLTLPYFSTTSNGTYDTFYPPPCGDNTDFTGTEITVDLIQTAGPPVSDGVCDEACGAPAAPIDPDPGACCYLDECYDYLTESLCAGIGGDWDAGGCGNCGEPGICCINGDCLVGLYEQLCVAIGGEFTLGGTCEGDPCSLTGACCRSDGSCDDDVEEFDCEGVGEYWHGIGSECADIDCNMTACCSGPPIPAGNCACSDQTWAGCAGGTETPLGRGTTCADPDGFVCDNNPVDCGWV